MNTPISAETGEQGIAVRLLLDTLVPRHREALRFVGLLFVLDLPG